MSTSDPRHYDVIIAPVITEKATMGSEHNKVTFKVARDRSVDVDVANCGGHDT